MNTLRLSIALFLSIQFLSPSNVCAQEALKSLTRSDEKNLKSEETVVTTPASDSLSHPVPAVNKLTDFELFVFGESYIAALSFIASLNPQVGGGLDAFIITFGFLDHGGIHWEVKEAWPTELVFLGSFGAVAIYNITELDKEKDSQRDIFIKNFVGLNIALALSATTGYLTGNRKDQKPVSINYIPFHDGVLLQASYRF